MTGGTAAPQLFVDDFTIIRMNEDERGGPFDASIASRHAIAEHLTRDGTFLIENGALAGPVKNFRFNQSLIDLFGKVEALGEAQTLGNAVLPHLRVADFRFSSGTDF